MTAYEASKSASTDAGDAAAMLPDGCRDVAYLAPTAASSRAMIIGHGMIESHWLRLLFAGARPRE